MSSLLINETLFISKLIDQLGEDVVTLKNKGPKSIFLLSI